MAKKNIIEQEFGSIYPLYIQKIERKGRTKEELNKIIYWLTGYDELGLNEQLEKKNSFETFFTQAPKMHENRSMIKGKVCGIRVEDIEDSMIQNIRYLDKLIDELAAGKTMEKILRNSY